ncbi:MAG: hypothetical protein ACK5XN_25795, partial [Bacteroidota bacterium]
MPQPRWPLVGRADTQRRDQVAAPWQSGIPSSLPIPNLGDCSSRGRPPATSRQVPRWHSDQPLAHGLIWP